MEHVLKIKGTKKKWYNEYYQQAVGRRRIAQEKFISVKSIDTNEFYTLERKSCKRIIQRKKEISQ